MQSRVELTYFDKDARAMSRQIARRNFAPREQTLYVTTPDHMTAKQALTMAARIMFASEARNG